VSLALVALGAALGAAPGAATVERIEIGDAFFAFDLPEGWEAIPEPTLREHLAEFRWGFQHASRQRFGDLPLILIDYRPLQITPDTPRQWQRAAGGEARYDPERQLLVTRAPIVGRGWNGAVSRRAVFFGRYGAAILTFVSSERDAERYGVDFDRVIDSFAFDPRHAWRPHFVWRLAAAGALVALLTGLGISLHRRSTRDAA
jgi:hypothetical protein